MCQVEPSVLLLQWCHILAHGCGQGHMSPGHYPQSLVQHLDSYTHVLKGRKIPLGEKPQQQILLRLRFMLPLHLTWFLKIAHGCGHSAHSPCEKSLYGKVHLRSNLRARDGGNKSKILPLGSNLQFQTDITSV